MILCCGEALIDMLPRKSETGEDVFLPCGGGAAFNTAVALGRLGVPAGLVSGLSTDMFGDILLREMAQSSVSAKLAIRSDRPTTLAFLQLLSGQAEYGFFDENTAGRMILSADLPVIPDKVQAMIFGGISLASEPCGSSYETLMERQKSRCVTMIDPNIRPGSISDATDHRARIIRMLAMADMVKLSDEDMHWIFGKGQLADLAQNILKTGPSVVFVTKGAQGASAYCRDFSQHQSAANIAVVDTVGAGDTFNAGVLAALFRSGALNKPGIAALDQATVAAALALGAQAAGISVSRAGANPPWADDF